MWTVCLGILVLFLAYQSVKAGNARGKIDYKKNLDEVCVTVDGKELTFRDLAFYVAYEELTIQEQALVYDADNTKKYWNLHINGEFVRVAARESAIQMAIHDQIFYEMAMEEGILLTEEDKQALEDKQIDFWEDLTEDDGQERIGVSKEEIETAMEKIAYAEKYQEIYAELHGKKYDDYAFNAEAYEEFLEDHSYEIVSDWKRVDMGNVSICHY